MFSRPLLILSLLSVSPFPLPAQTLNKVTAVNPKGSVSVMKDLTGLPSPVSKDTSIEEGHTVTTGPEGRVDLLFSNGCTVSLSPETKVTMVQFWQTPHENKDNLSYLREEPSRSNTRLKLDYGTIVGHTKKLHPYSSYLVETPLGMAVTQGANWIIRLDPLAPDTMTGWVGVIKGGIVFTSNDGANSREIDSHQQIVVELRQAIGEKPRLDFSAPQRLLSDLHDEAENNVLRASEALLRTLRDSQGEPAIILPEIEGQMDPARTLGGRYRNWQEEN